MYWSQFSISQNGVFVLCLETFNEILADLQYFLQYVVYAEHVMNNEYLQTDGIEGRECWLVEQCSHFFWPYLSQALTGNENTSTQTAPPFLFLYPYLYQLASESVCFFAQWHAYPFTTMETTTTPCFCQLSFTLHCCSPMSLYVPLPMVHLKIIFKEIKSVCYFWWYAWLEMNST